MTALKSKGFSLNHIILELKMDWLIHPTGPLLSLRPQLYLLGPMGRTDSTICCILLQRIQFHFIDLSKTNGNMDRSEFS